MMSKGLILLFALCTLVVHSQEVLNGSFEDNSFVPWDNNGCNFDNGCGGYHQNMAHSNAWESISYAGNTLCFIGAITEDCTLYFNLSYVWGPPPQDGDWSVLIYGSHLDPSWTNLPDPNPNHKANAISLALSAPLEVGRIYALRYYILAFPPSVVPDVVLHTAGLSVGISEKDTAFGEHIHTSIFPDSVWRQQSVVFEASLPAQHITFKINTPSPQTDVLLKYAVLIDNVSLSTNLFLSNQPKMALKLYPNPSTGFVRIEARGTRVAVFDLLGKERYRSEMNQRHHLFIHDWPQGVYIIKTYDNKQVIATAKLIKNK